MCKRCSNCIFNNTDQCENSLECTSYSPIIEIVSDEEIFDLVEEGRKEYRKEWQRYISDNFFESINIDLRAL
ncbi:MAG: hypothetical protein MJZ03_00025 [archaeon]|nr:hypothetical protein [archaeon]